MDSLRHDFRYAVRSLIARPGFSLLTILTLAVGIGVNTVAFSAINALLLRPFKMREPDRAGWIMMPAPGNPRGTVTVRELDVLTRSTRAFETIAAEARLPVSVRTDNGAEQGWALLVTTTYLPSIDARPTTGRLLADADLTAGELPAVISHRFWRERLGSPGSLAGQRFAVNGRTVAPVGVLPDSFQGIGGLYAPDMWLPVARIDELNVPAPFRDAPILTLFGRLRPGVTHAQARTELGVIARQLAPAADTPGAPARGGEFYPLRDGHPEVKTIGRVAWLGFAAVSIVLVIACFNVTSLMMARAAERQREISVRSALGASRSRILRQLLIEGLILAGVGGSAALVVAAWSADLLATFSLPSPIPQRLHLGVDPTLVVFTVLAVAIAGALPALLPGLQATRSNLLRSMRMESALGGRPSRARNAFVVVQIAGSTLFVVAALLFARSFTRTLATPTGFDTSHTVALELSPSLYGYDAVRAKQLFESLQQRVAEQPGIRHVAIGERVPFYVGFPRTERYTAGAPCQGADCRSAVVYRVGRGYFEALGVPVRAGRDFTDADVAAGSAVIISERMAAQTWPGESAIGRALKLGDPARPVEVIGVVADYTHRNVAEAPAAYAYLPLQEQNFRGGLTLVARTHGDPAAVVAGIREHVRTLDPDLPSAAIATLEERMKMPQWMPRTTAGFFLVCGTLALVLASVGLFGVMYFTVAQRTREFGVRAALGATTGRIVRVVMTEGLRLAVPGVFLGLAGGYVLARVLSRVLFGVAPADIVSFGGTAALQVLVAVAACALPAYRAAKADPMQALRAD